MDDKVPAQTANLLVPNTVDNACSGNACSKAGIKINPPPPTAASIKPPKNENTPSVIMSIVISLYKLPMFTTNTLEL
ncbi:hypothetical protein [Marinomonas alcarazii]|uniref:hypothetical protein n=1 Tax=Marinomonas alcarazii TaxID=491949 RepID=UPI001FE3BE46|nr:hypothetical protein [Marinomonas alcarazii]